MEALPQSHKCLRDHCLMFGRGSGMGTGGTVIGERLARKCSQPRRAEHKIETHLVDLVAVIAIAIQKMLDGTSEVLLHPQERVVS